MDRIPVLARLAIRLLAAAAIAFSLSAFAGTVDYTYDPAGRLIEVNWGNGKVTTFLYDDNSNVLTKQTVVPTVVGRFVFYNNSAWDGAEKCCDPEPCVDDDDAIAADKLALLPGEPATFANYTSFNKGLNGIIIDIQNLADPLSLSLADFSFRMGNNDDPATWATAPDPLPFDAETVCLGEGTGGSDRITLVWADNNLDATVDANEAVAKQWLEVTVKALNTGLAADDVFYFGNAVGESGDDAANAIVDPADELRARANQVNLAGGGAAIDNPFDYNRDKLVDPGDQLIARSNQANLSTSLKLISPPAGGGGSLLAFAQGPLIGEADTQPSAGDIDASPRPEALRLTVHRLADGQHVLRFRAPTGAQAFRLLEAPSLGGLWSEVASPTGDQRQGDLVEMVLPEPDGAGGARFYRVEQLVE